MLYSIKPEYNYMVDYYSVFLSILAGLFSTLMMSILEFPFWRKWGLEGVLEWHENQVLYSKFFKTDKSQINFPGIFLSKIRDPVRPFLFIRSPHILQTLFKYSVT